MDLKGERKQLYTFLMWFLFVNQNKQNVICPVMKNKFYFKEYLYDKLTGQLMTNMPIQDDSGFKYHNTLRFILWFL